MRQKRFDSNGYTQALRTAFYAKLEAFADKVAKDMVNSMAGGTDAVNWFSGSVKQYVKYKTHRAGKRYHCLIGIIDAPEHVYFKAFIMAYGSGTKINKEDNPWFDDYYTGEFSGCKYWNVTRFKSGAITYRPLGETYYDFYHNTFNSGHGPNRQGKYHALPLKSFEPQDTPWFNRALELNGVTSKEYMANKIKDMMNEAFNEVPASRFFK